MKSPAAIITALADRFYFPFIRKWLPLHTFRYAFSGGLNLIFDTILYSISYYYIFCESDLNLGLVVISPHIAALCLVFPITFTNGFLLNRYVAFKKSPLRGRIQLFRYGLSVAGAFLVNYALMKIFVDGLHISALPSKILTSAVTTIYSYLMQRFFSFKGFQS